MRKQTPPQLQIDHNEDDCATSTQILERVQPDRVAITKPEEDRRRRTIIVEKKKGSYGFTLQSYGIHYKKEHEIEMITYVDYVDYDGPAYRSGMREGDVILSINGADMEKADHKTLVNFIKSCDTRMRMVVLFEDCVRKVELHMRYIQLQRILQAKMSELEKLCMRERQLLEGKWKTHSLPARKKTSKNAPAGAEPGTPTQTSNKYCRPTLSTEDVAKMQQKTTVMLAYQYLDRRYSYVLPSTSGSGEYLLTFEPPRYNTEPHFVVKTPCDLPPKANKANQTSSESASKTYTCNPCLQANNNGDNTSLDAYDLASPCCDPHCIPNTRRRSRNTKDQRKRESKTGETQTDPVVLPQQRPRPLSQSSQIHLIATAAQTNPPRRYMHLGAGVVSQCSLYSCTSSELSAIAPTTTGESSASYTTSLSTDTLYWDGSNDISTSRTVPSGVAHHDSVYIQYAKPKSWDNLATKAIGGYGFGYGYLDTTKCVPKQHNRTQSTKSNTQYFRVCKEPHQSRRYMQPTKSIESLLGVPKYSDASHSCECLDPNVLSAENVESRFFQSPKQSVISPTDPSLGYYSSSRSTASRNNNTAKDLNSEATRL